MPRGRKAQLKQNKSKNKQIKTTQRKKESRNMKSGLSFL